MQVLYSIEQIHYSVMVIVMMIKIMIREAASKKRIRIKKIRKIKNPGSQSSLIEKMKLAKGGSHPLTNEYMNKKTGTLKKG